MVEISVGNKRYIYNENDIKRKYLQELKVLFYTEKLPTLMDLEIILSMFDLHKDTECFSDIVEGYGFDEEGNSNGDVWGYDGPDGKRKLICWNVGESNFTYHMSPNLVAGYTESNQKMECYVRDGEEALLKFTCNIS